MAKRLSPEEAAALGLSTPAKQPRRLSPEEAAALGLSTPAKQAPDFVGGYTFSKQGPYLETPTGELLSPRTKEPLKPEALGWPTGVLPDAAEKDRGLAAARALGFEDAYANMAPQDKTLLARLESFTPVEREKLAEQFLDVYRRAFFAPGTTRGLAREVARSNQEFIDKAQAFGVDVRTQEDPGVLNAIAVSAPKAIPFYDELRGVLADPSVIRKAAVGATEPTGLSQMLEKTSPDLFKRLRAGDLSVTDEQIKDAVTQGIRKEENIASLYSPTASLLTELGANVAVQGGLAKTLGAAAFRPSAVALTEAAYGAGRGETTGERIGGALTGAVGGYLAGRGGTALGEKAASVGVGGAPLRGKLDVLAANRAQKRIDVLLAPEKAKALKAYLEDKALLKKEFEAMAAGDIEKEIATRAKEVKAYKKALEDKVITKAEFEKLAAADIEKEIAKRAAAGDKAAQLYQKDIGDWQLAEAKLENVARKEFEAEQKNALREFQSTKDAEDALQAEALKLAREDLGVSEAAARARQARTVALEESRGIFRKNAKIQERIDKLEARYAEAGAKLDDLEATVEGKVARYHGTELEKASRSREVAINLLDEKLARGEITEADAFAQLEQILKTSERDAEQLLKQAAEQVEAAKLGTTRPEMRAEKEVAKQRENLQKLRDTLKQKLDAQVALADKTTNTSTADPQVYQASLNRQLNDLRQVGLAVPSFDEVSARARELIDSGELAKRVPKTKQLAEIIQANRAKPAPTTYTPEAANAEIAKKILANRERYLRENPELGKILGKPSPVEVKRLPEWAAEPPLSPEELRRRAAEKFAAEQEQYFFREPAMKARLQSELPPEPTLGKPLPEAVPPAEDLQKMAAQKFETEKAEYALRVPAKMAKYEAPYVPPSEAELAKGLEKGRTLATPERVREGISFNIPFTKGRISFGETVPPESSVDISDKYLFDAATIAKQKAQKAMATPIAVPAAQAITRGITTDVTKPLYGQESAFWDWLSKQQTASEEDEARKKQSTSAIVLDAIRKLTAPAE